MIQKCTPFLIFSIFCMVACTYKSIPTALPSNFLEAADITHLPATDSNYKICKDSENYIPDSSQLALFPEQKIRVNFHFMDCEARNCNYAGERAVHFAKQLLYQINTGLSNNKQMWLPPGNKTAVLPPRYRYVLSPQPDAPEEDGIYFHYDDSLYFHDAYGKDKNNTNPAVIKKYGINTESVLNIFLMPDRPGILEAGEKSSAGTGIYIAKAIKVGIKKEEGKGKPWELRGLINHEIGHFLGLSHTWKGNDGCDDTPHHTNCYNRGGPPPCDKSGASNNMMDYNAMQNAITPCQIGRIQRNFYKMNSRQRNVLIPSWCALNQKNNIIITKKTGWNCHKDLEGHLTIASGAELTIKCRLSIPKNGMITVQAGAKLILDQCKLHNDCGEKWAGIRVLGEGANKGQVVFIGEPILENMIHELASKSLD